MHRILLPVVGVAVLLAGTAGVVEATPVAQFQWTECEDAGDALFGQDALCFAPEDVILSITNLTVDLDLTALVLELGGASLDLQDYIDDGSLPLGVLPFDGIQRDLYFLGVGGKAQATFSFAVTLPAGLVLSPAVAALTRDACLVDTFCSAEVAAVPTPEPATLGLVLAGTTWLFRVGRRGRHRP